MGGQQWREILLSPGNEDHIWELFHENSKNSRFATGLSDEQVFERVRRFHESLPFEGYPVVKLPNSLEPLKPSLAQAITSRCSGKEMTPCMLTLTRLKTLLHYAYGRRAYDHSTLLHRSLRVVPSAGALYPLEIFFHSAHIKELDLGLYHYNPVDNLLRLLREGDQTPRVSKTVIQPEIVINASLIIFITAIFERTIFKYRDRGYRFVMLEAGHVAQNINLVSTALGLGCVNIGGYFDREVDDFLELDGVTHSTIYMIAVGKRKVIKTIRHARCGGS